MEIIKNNDVTIRLGYNLEEKIVKGDIYYKDVKSGVIIGDKFFINSKCYHMEKVAEECEKMRPDLEDYIRMWKEHEEYSKV